MALPLRKRTSAHRTGKLGPPGHDQILARPLRLSSRPVSDGITATAVVRPELPVKCAPMRLACKCCRHAGWEPRAVDQGATAGRRAAGLPGSAKNRMAARAREAPGRISRAAARSRHRRFLAFAQATPDPESTNVIRSNTMFCNMYFAPLAETALYIRARYPCIN